MSSVKKSPVIIAFLLGLTFLMALPSLVTIPKVYGSNQSGDTRWSPFGPQEQNLIFSVYDGAQTMFTDFDAGKLDFTDSPVIAADSSSYCANPDYFCTAPTATLETYAALNGWNFQQCDGSTCANTQSSIVNTKDKGTKDPFWTLLNARQVPGYTPTMMKFSPGGGDPNLIRMGFSQTVSNLSPFLYTSQSEANVLSEIFDSMLRINPLTSPSDNQILDWQTTMHSSTFFPLATCSSPGTGTVTGCTTQVWTLRNDLKFQDGSPVTAVDVAYSILAYRDVPSVSLRPNVVNVDSAVGLNCGLGQPCNKLQVVLALQNPSYELDIGGLPILEKFLWVQYCGPVPMPGFCSSSAFDPMAAGIMIGDGPYSCIVPSGFSNAGHIGGSCTTTAGNELGNQNVIAGGRILLQRNSLYLRCCPSGPGATSSSLYKLSYADRDNDGVVEFYEVAEIAGCFGLAAGETRPQVCPSPNDSNYWVNSNIAPGTIVNINDLATVAFYYGAGTVSYDRNSVLSTMTGIDPQIDPFFCPTTGC